MDKRLFLAFAAVFGLLLLGLLIGTSCIPPIILDAKAGDMVLACVFPWPWTQLFGIGRQYFYFNFYLLVGIPAGLLMLYFLGTLFKKDN